MAERLSGIAAGAVGIGSLFVYAGVKGYSVPHAIQALVTGQAPSTGGQANPVGTPAGGGGTGPSGSGPGVIKAGQTGWSTAFLAAIGAPGSNANIVSVNAWQSREGGGGQNNPLNTTLDCCGATGSINSAGVKNYPTVADGVMANAKTLTGGGYGDVLMALKSGRGLCGQSFPGLARWSNGAYSKVC